MKRTLGIVFAAAVAGAFAGGLIGVLLDGGSDETTAPAAAATALRRSARPPPPAAASPGSRSTAATRPASW